MARGRMLNWTVTESMKFHKLPDDTCRLLATWTISLLDAYGVFHADPVLVKSRVFPMRDDIAIEQIKKCLDAMESIGLIKRFEHEGRMYQYWPGFNENQPNLHHGREKSSGFPKPPGADDHPKADGVPVSNNGDTPIQLQQIGLNSCDSSPANIRQTSGDLPENYHPQSNLIQSNLISADAQNKNLSISNSAQPIPMKNTSQFSTLPAKDFIDYAFRIAEKNATNTVCKYEAVIREWRLPIHLEDVCIEFVRLSQMPVKITDKGKWARGAKDINDLGAAKTMSAAFEKGKADNLTLTWPGALTELCRGCLAALSPADTGPVVPSNTFWFYTQSGERRLKVGDAFYTGLEADRMAVEVGVSQ